MLAEPARSKPIIDLLPYQREDVESEARFRWNCWARQTGKSFTKSLRRLLRGLRRRRTQIFLSAGERQCRELMAKLRQHCQALKIATDYYDDRPFRDLGVRKLEVVLPGGVRIIGLPANPQTARGFTGDVLLDEFAMHAEDREIWAAMFPSLLRGDGELDVASTPKGCGNMFDQLRGNDLFESSLITLPDAVAQGLDVDPAAVREAMNDDELYRQEFLCEFLDETTAFITYDQISRCIDLTLTPRTDIESLAAVPHDLFVGVDIGRKRDLTVFWVLARRGELLETAAIIELSNTSFSRQFDLLCAVLRLRRVRGCCIDAGGIGMQLAEQAVEQFGPDRVEPVTFSVGTKSQLAAGLRIAVENARILIPNDERLKNDWHSVRRGFTESGQFKLSAPRSGGSHADRFWAAALAIRAAGSVGETSLDLVHGGPLRFARSGAW